LDAKLEERLRKKAENDQAKAEKVKQANEKNKSEMDTKLDERMRLKAEKEKAASYKKPTADLPTPSQPNDFANTPQKVSPAELKKQNDAQLNAKLEERMRLKAEKDRAAVDRAANEERNKEEAKRVSAAKMASKEAKLKKKQRRP
jgi:hypothetical protein